MVEKLFIPDRGDIVWLNFNPQTGYEQRGRRPALVISPAIYNAKTGMAFVCPITSQKKGYPFEVSLGSNKVNGVVLADQVKSVDWQGRQAEIISRGNKVIFEKTQMLLRELI